jgi:uncharacterized RDD family membrane protein YckC
MSYTPPPPPAGGGYSAAGGGAGDVPANLADPIKRLIAALIDGGIVIAIIIVTLILAAVLGNVSGALGALVAIVGYLGAIGFSIYNQVVTQGNTGQTVGKKMQGIKVIGEETGQPLGAGGAFIRWLVHGFIDGICLAGYIYGFFISPKRQTVGDIVAKSLVVNA